MNKYLGAAMVVAAFVAQSQAQVVAQSADGLQAQTPQQAQPAALDAPLRGPVDTPGSTAAPFSSSSAYSYKEQPPANVPSGGYDPNAAAMTPAASAPAAGYPVAGAPAVGYPAGNGGGYPGAGDGAGGYPGGAAGGYPGAGNLAGGGQAVGMPGSAPFSSAKSRKSRGGFSPAGAVLGVPDRAMKSSLGLTDRTLKTGIGIPAKTTKEVFKAIF